MGLAEIAPKIGVFLFFSWGRDKVIRPNYACFDPGQGTVLHAEMDGKNWQRQYLVATFEVSFARREVCRVIFEKDWVYTLESLDGMRHAVIFIQAIEILTPLEQLVYGTS